MGEGVVGMGVDIEWGVLPVEVAEAWRTAVDRHHGTDAERCEAFERYERSGAVFQTAWDSMRDLKRAMRKLGMLCGHRQPNSIEMPAEVAELAGDYFAVQQHITEGTPLPDGVEPANVEALRSYLAACDELLARMPYGGTRGIPAYKLSDNSPWLIQPEEIRSAMEVYQRSAGCEEIRRIVDPESWDEWIAYITTAAEHGGFRMG